MTDAEGSPPRVRGTQPFGGWCVWGLGLTPAGAGNTPEGPARRHEIPGSPPRVRGTRGGLGPRRQHHGLTPAGAGNTGSAPRGIAFTQAHPRGCGEHRAALLDAAVTRGSPPRVRGTLPDRGQHRTRPGLTPAGAGNTRCSPCKSTANQAHPRGCGEHASVWCQDKLDLGSPPRVRGTHRQRRRHPADRGLTPAGAGNTGSRTRPEISLGAHPRGCGEHIERGGLPEAFMGSPPRVRGTPRLCRAVCPPARLTPAGAGNTPRSKSAPWTGWAHPRGCGEHQNPPSPPGTSRGSPPRVRGTRAARLRRDRRHRLTPAGAGNTDRSRSHRCSCWAHPRGCGEHGGALTPTRAV